MTKNEFIEKTLAEARGTEHAITRVDAERVWDAACKVIRAELLAGGEISMQGVGKLKVKETAARTGRNPRTGEEIHLPAGKKVAFVPGKDFKDEMKI